MLAEEPVPAELDAGLDDSQWARQKWRPAAVATHSDALVPLYQVIPSRFPPLYEQLVLSYRWLAVELDGILRLVSNPPGPTLHALLADLTKDPVFCHVLLPLGLIPFGRACGDNYDLVCFDTRRRRQDGDCPIVGVKHESVLCNLQLGQTWQVAPTFRKLVEMAISKAAQLPAR